MSYRIEELFALAEEPGPVPRTSTDEIIAGARRIKARRRWAAVAGAGAAAVVTVAVVAGITAGVPRAKGPGTSAAASPSATRSKPAAPKAFAQPKGLGFSVGTSRVDQWQVGPVSSVTYGYQEIPVYRDGVTMNVDSVDYPYPEAMIVLYRPGRYDIKGFGVTEPESKDKYGPPKDVTVAGRPGIERQFSYDLPDLEDMRAKLKANPKLPPFDKSIKTEHFTRTAFAWKYDRTAWATFLPWTNREPLSRAESLAIIEALKPEPVRPAKAPYAFGWLPDGLRVTAVRQQRYDDVSTVIIDRKIPAGDSLTWPVDDYEGVGRLTVYLGPPKPHNTPAKGQDLKCTDVNGYCTMLLGGGYAAELQKVGRSLSMNDVRRILRELKFTDVADRNTWKPLD